MKSHPHLTEQILDAHNACSTRLLQPHLCMALHVDYQIIRTYVLTFCLPYTSAVSLHNRAYGAVPDQQLCAPWFQGSAPGVAEDKQNKMPQQLLMQMWFNQIRITTTKIKVGHRPTLLRCHFHLL